MLLTSLLTSGILGLVSIGAMALAWRKSQRVRELNHQLYTAKTQANLLVAAQEDLEQAVFDDEKVRKFLAKNPSLLKFDLVKKVIQEDPSLVSRDHLYILVRDNMVVFKDRLNEFFKTEGVLHDWKNLGGDQKLVIGKDANDKPLTDKLKSEKCFRCGIIHRFFEGSGSPDMREYEGYFIGGKRLDVIRMPPCLFDEDDKAKTTSVA